MAKKKSKSNLKSLIISILCAVFGILLFCSMFMPLFNSKADDGTKFSSVNVATAMGVDSISDAIDLNESEKAACLLVAEKDEEYHTDAKVKATAILNIIASCVGAIIAIGAVLSIFCKAKLLRSIILVAGLVAILASLASLIAGFVFIGTKMDMGIMTQKVSEYVGINAATFVGLISAAVASACAFIKK